MRLFVVPLLLTACSVVPTDRGPSPDRVLEARVDALEARSVALEARAEALEARARALEGRGVRNGCCSGGFAGLPTDAVRERRERRERHGSVPAEPKPTSKQHLTLFDGSVDELTTTDIAGLGRALLHRGANGDFDGYRLSAIRRDSLGEQLGLHNGDVVHSVNGHPLRSMTEAMQAFEAVRDDDQLRIELTRRGERIDLTVVLTD